MRRLSVAIVASIAFVQFASAADLPRKAPAYAPPPPVWSWTGFYIGVNAGGSIGRDPSSFFQGPAAVPIATNTMSPAGFIGGGQIGYNWQFAPHWVVGVEGDFQGASQRDSVSGLGFLAGTSFTATQKVEWFATARGRFGYTGSPWLVYVTGGAAWAKVHNDLFVTGPIITEPGSADYNVSGWTIGGGIEVRLAGGWTGKLEYLYLDLGSITDFATTNPPVAAFAITQTSDIRDHIVRVGLNYKFY